MGVDEERLGESVLSLQEVSCQRRISRAVSNNSETGWSSALFDGSPPLTQDWNLEPSAPCFERRATTRKGWDVVTSIAERSYREVAETGRSMSLSTLMRHTG